MAITVPTGPAASQLKLSGLGQATPYYQTSGPNGSTAATFSTQPPAAPVIPRAAPAAPAAPVDPNAGKIAAALASGQDSQLQTGIASASAAGANYQGQAGALYGTLAQGQNSIDQARKNIGIKQINSIKDLTNTIRQGLTGTGVNLASTNALDSSAAGTAARIYSNYGNVETNKINNGASIANEDQDVAQTNLGIQRDVGMSGLKSFRDNAVASITTEAQKGLDGLKQYIALLGGNAAGVNVDGIRQQILQAAQDKLGAVDHYIQTTVGGVHAAAPDQIAQGAYQSSNAGVVPSGGGLPYQLDQPINSQKQQLGGADTSLIPLALKPRQSS